MNSIGDISKWALNIRKLGYPFASETDFKTAVENLQNSKTSIESIDDLFENIGKNLIFEDNCCKITFRTNKIPWKSVAGQFRAGRVKSAFCTIGMFASNITVKDEELLQSYLKLIVPEYHMSLYNRTLIKAADLYPELQFIPKSSKHLEAMLGPNVRKIIDNGIVQMQDASSSNSLTINGFYGKLLKSSDKSMYIRLFESLQYLPGCYYVTHTSGSLTSCKIETKSCGSKDSCKELETDMPNIYIFMLYLLKKSMEGDESFKHLLQQLNETLTNKITDEASIETILQDPTEANKVYTFQSILKLPIGTCTFYVEKINEISACKPNETFTSKTSANNELSNETTMHHISKNNTVLMLLVDLSLGTSIDFLNLQQKETFEYKTPNRIFRNVPWLYWIVLVVAFIILLILSVKVTLLKRNKNNVVTQVVTPQRYSSVGNQNYIR